MYIMFVKNSCTMYLMFVKNSCTMYIMFVKNSCTMYIMFVKNITYVFFQTVDRQEQSRCTSLSPQQSTANKQQLIYDPKLPTNPEKLIRKKSVQNGTTDTAIELKSPKSPKSPLQTTVENRAAGNTSLLSVVSDQAGAQQPTLTDKLTAAKSQQLISGEELERRKRRALIMDR